jgi:xanthine dehydrogenase accessory factor
MNLYEEILRLQREGVPAALVTVIETAGAVPREPGTKMVVTGAGQRIGTVGGGAWEAQILKDAVEVVRSGKARKVRYHLDKDLGMDCGGRMEVFIEPLELPYRLLIFGAGHIGTALCRLGKYLGFYVTVVDERPEWADPERLPEADEVIAKPYREAVAEQQFGERTFIAVITHDHLLDEQVLVACAQQSWAYLGMIGSRKKGKHALDKCRAAGVPEETLARIHTPIGLDLGAESPEEIAVSIVAEMLAVKYGKENPTPREQVPPAGRPAASGDAKSA